MNGLMIQARSVKQMPRYHFRQTSYNIIVSDTVSGNQLARDDPTETLTPDYEVGVTSVGRITNKTHKSSANGTSYLELANDSRPRLDTELAHLHDYVRKRAQDYGKRKRIRPQTGDAKNRNTQFIPSKLNASWQFI